MRRTATRMMIERSDRDARQARLAEVLRIAQERVAALNAHALPVTEIHYASDPGPDFTPRTWGWLS